ncbi:MAG TPA: hypothetical protein PKC76_13125 [Saprospiraceae bacterium]|nr:hypothetical protein [Saprospiraceae bacterium]HMP25074.1 hypothetical protein [Saprospiraceae bacterium]
MKSEAIFFAPFMFSGILSEETLQKVAFPNNNMLEQTLNAQLQLDQYGTGVHSIACVFIALPPPDNGIHDETLIYRRREKEVFAQVKIPYDLVASYDADQVLQLMATTYLQALERLDELRIPNFDSVRLAQDVQRLFETQGWLARETA